MNSFFFNLILIFTLGTSSNLWATANVEIKKIELKKIFTEIPNTSLDFLNKSFSKEALPSWGLILGSSALLYHYDEDLLIGSQNTGRRWGLSNSDKTKTIFKIGQYDILRLPSDTASALYFMGDGWLDIGVVVGFFTVGYCKDSARPYNTSLQLLHGMMVSAIFDQIIKRSTGRESPTDESEPRGKWRPFPSMSAYNANTAKYDAMPSGHMMTSTLVWTIIRGNYAEYDNYLFPMEITWLSTLGFAMLNNGVHWASDYPLGIAIGYVIGKSSLQLGQRQKNEETSQTAKWIFYPSTTENGLVTANALKFF